MNEELEQFGLIDPITQLKENRRHKLNSWLVLRDGSRWEGDDGRILRLDEYQFWSQNIKDAEQAYFAKIDAEYEQAKSNLT